MSKIGEVLVAIMNNPADFSIAHDKHWYRIPYMSVKKLLKNNWPPQWLTFYHTKAFKDQAFSVKYYARVLRINEIKRWQLFPDQPLDSKCDNVYYQLLLEPLQELITPIFSRRWRRIIFIPTTWEKFNGALEINDLYSGSALEDQLWAALKGLKIPAERQDSIRINSKNYFLDFAIYCQNGKLDIETDGDKWHHTPEIAPKDNIRNNALVNRGWQVLRFTKDQICCQLSDYCMPLIVNQINNLGGVEIEKNIFQRIDLHSPGDSFNHSVLEH
jgi:very-short-patch-repair endonuclease